MLVLAVHGSPAPGTGRTIARLVQRLDRPALVGHLDAQCPSLADVLARHPGATVVPLLLGNGYHRTVDIPALTRRHHCTLTEGLAGEPDVARAVHERLVAAGGPGDAIVVAGAGSTRPGGIDGTRAVARELSRTHPDLPVVDAYCSAARPTVPDRVEALRRAGFRRITIATHLLAPGRFTRALEATPGVHAVSAPIADHPLIARLVLNRYESVRPEVLAA
ncbi:sirohydrochlorin chelatase [Streptomyces sp. NBC_00083]|uniref:sirohydrochlorin chelatase n=1 Tax=Streptomyces sp. NBC_00083 TaxID=2975647 RepID=UPI002257D1A2|nr:CbiX/SirB N-terminal domain-containing protein [Streptomyces sp. NBC_00083]MCX5381904.1 sirohydrochlorin chelatase [Streptomyces sp. NBC_00083]